MFVAIYQDGKKIAQTALEGYTLQVISPNSMQVAIADDARDLATEIAHCDPDNAALFHEVNKEGLFT